MTTLAQSIEQPATVIEGGPSSWQYFRGVVSTMLTVLVVVVASLSIVIAAVTHFSPKGQFRVFGHPVMIVLSGSMTPVIRTGDLVIDNPLTKTQVENLHVGQIISFRDSPGSQIIITHRIVGVERSGGSVSYITKGDANNAADASPRPASDVIGLFSTVIPRGGYVLNALHKPIVLGLLLASAMLWLTAGPLFRLARRMDMPDVDSSAGTTDGTERGTV